jgi:hypothetical protein
MAGGDDAHNARLAVGPSAIVQARLFVIRPTLRADGLADLGNARRSHDRRLVAVEHARPLGSSGLRRSGGNGGGWLGNKPYDSSGADCGRDDGQYLLDHIDFIPRNVAFKSSR